VGYQANDGNSTRIVPREDILRLSMADFLIVLALRLVSVSARGNRPSHRWHTEALGSSAQIRCVSLSCREYRVMAKRASRVPRIIQMLIRITADTRVLISSASENPRYRR
jgi:hypothetical protein